MVHIGSYYAQLYSYAISDGDLFIGLVGDRRRSKNRERVEKSQNAELFEVRRTMATTFSLSNERFSQLHVDDMNILMAVSLVFACLYPISIPECVMMILVNVWATAFPSVASVIAVSVRIVPGVLVVFLTMLLTPLVYVCQRILKKPAKPVARCTAPDGLVDSLPAELLPHLLASGRLEAADLAHVAATCKAFAHVVTKDAAADTLLWQPVCRRRWADKAYIPLDVFPEMVSELNWRQTYKWAEQDARRQLGTGDDLSRVVTWSVKFPGQDAYVVGPWAYRIDGRYVSPTFREGNVPMRYSVKSERMGANVVMVDGIPDVRMVRRADWGWELRNMMWVARSVIHAPQPHTEEEIRRYGRSGYADLQNWSAALSS